MIRQSLRALIGILLSSTCCSALFAQQIPSEPVPELLDQVAQLFESVFDDEIARVDDATCLGDLLHAQLAREEALNLVLDASDPNLVAARSQAVRANVFAFVERLFDDGESVESVDASRILLVEPGEVNGETEEETVMGTGDDVLAITATGVLGIKMVGLQRTVDVGVYRLGDRWCVDPLSMQ